MADELNVWRATSSNTSMRNVLFAFAVCALVAARPRCGAAVDDDTEHVSRTMSSSRAARFGSRPFPAASRSPATDSSEVVDRRRPPRAARAAQPHRARHPHARARTRSSSTPTSRERSWFCSPATASSRPTSTSRCRAAPTSTSTCSARRSASTASKGRRSCNGFSSRITLNDVAGPVQAHTFSGSVMMRAKAWEADQTIDLDTFSGSIELHVPETARGTRHLQLVQRPPEFRDAADPAQRAAGARSTPSSAAAAAATLRFKTFSGNVRIDR